MRAETTRFGLATNNSIFLANAQRTSTNNYNLTQFPMKTVSTQKEKIVLVFSLQRIKFQTLGSRVAASAGLVLALRSPPLAEVAM